MYFLVLFSGVSTSSCFTCSVMQNSALEIFFSGSRIHSRLFIVRLIIGPASNTMVFMQTSSWQILILPLHQCQKHFLQDLSCRYSSLAPIGIFQVSGRLSRMIAHARKALSLSLSGPGL